MPDSRQKNTDFISMATAPTLPGLFEARVRNSPHKIAYRQYMNATQSWRDYSWHDIYLLVSRWRHAMHQEGLEQGDRVAVMLPNCIEWVCFDQAAQSLGLVTVSLYTTDTPDNIAYILADAGARLLLVDQLQAWQRLADRCSPLAALASIWCLAGGRQSPSLSPSQAPPFHYVADILPASAPPYENSKPGANTLATLIYTSGTTGRPKGVMLSHHNLLSNADAVHTMVPAYPDDLFLSFLPLAHAFERTVEYILPMMAGSCVTYARSISLLRDDLLEIRPTVFISAPRLYEKIYAAIQATLAGNRIKQTIFNRAVELGWKMFLYQQQRGPDLTCVQKFQHKLLQVLVSQKVLNKLGGRIRVALTGAAPLSAKISRFFVGLGLPLLEGYGLTEASPVVSGNPIKNNIPGSVGVTLPGVEVSIANDGELLVRSAGVMLGYWQNDQATRQVIDQEGWLHTGDLGELKDNHLYITGRSKDILVTSTGEKVSPADMEATIILDPLFSQAMVIGEGKPYLSALLVLNEQAWSELAADLGLNPADIASKRDARAIEAVIARLAEVLSIFPGFAQIRAIDMTFEPWTVENGLLTPTMKIKRHVLEQRCADQIRALYRVHALID